MVWRLCDRSHCHSRTARAGFANNAKQSLGQWTMVARPTPSSFPSFHNGHSRPLSHSSAHNVQWGWLCFAHGERARRVNSITAAECFNYIPAHILAPYEFRIPCLLPRLDAPGPKSCLRLPRITFRRLRSAATAGSFGLGRPRLAALPDSPIKLSSTLSL